MDKSVTIIVPTWNRSSCLSKCLSLITNQSYSNIKAIVSDDGSTDNTYDIVCSIKDSRINYINDVNSGRPAIPRNRALKIAAGDVIAFCDSDDYWKKNKLETQLKLLKEKKVNAICSNAYLDQSNLKYFNDKSRMLTTLDLLRTNSVICSSVLVDSKIFRLCGPFDESLEMRAVEDYLQWLKISLFTDFYYTNQPLLEYTTNSSNSVRINQDLSEEVRYQKILFKFINFAFMHKKFTAIVFALYFLIKSKLKLMLKRLR